MAVTIPLKDLTVYSQEHLPAKDADFKAGSAFLLNKPKGKTSFQLVYELRSLLNGIKVGHAGTLDPMATGLLIVCVGKATKSIKYIQELDKVYTGEVTLGASTPSFDSETEIDQTEEWDHVTLKLINKTLDEQFSGTIVQYPPAYSAIRRNGERLYRKARRGEKVQVPPRQVTIEKARAYEMNGPRFKLDVTCSRGTYIRSLAHDIGKAINSLGYLSALQRTAIGQYKVDQAFSINDLESIL
ncbi:MAG: tRNA pseudouridine(55) synthase TruB [Bacteroidota bacterium]